MRGDLSEPWGPWLLPQDSCHCATLHSLLTARETPAPSGCGWVSPVCQEGLGGTQAGQGQCPKGSHPFPSFLFAPESTSEDYWAVNKGINGADGNISW